MPDKYIVIIQRAWCNDSGFGISYSSDLEEFDSRMDVINHDLDICDSDDFNIGTARNGRLVAFDWMDGPVKGHDLSFVADAIVLEGGNHA